jgi:hypothetical protein
MRAVRCIACLLACFSAPFACADDRLDVTGALDVRWIHATGTPSFLDGGLGTLRFDPEHEDLRLGRAFLAPRLRLSDTVTLHAVIDTYGDHDRNPLDLSEFWVDVRPFPTNAIRWHAKIGAFHMPVSLENRGVGWSDVYSITPSALNTWMGEEFRTIGGELEARWLGASHGYLGDLALVGAVYAWNDPAGGLLAARGFALTDRPSTLFGGLGRPPTTFYHEIDRKPGYYGGLSWRHHDWMELRLLRYDNADPGKSTAAGGEAWHTRFTSAGARFEPSAHWTFIAQYLDGDTATGSDFDAEDQFRMTYHVAFGLASYDWNRERITARVDKFGTHQSSGYYDGPPSNESGHAWTAAWTHAFGEQWQVAAEWIRVWSDFPPRSAIGVSPALIESQVQIAVRYRIHFGV